VFMTSDQIGKGWTETIGSRSGYAALKDEFSLATLVVRARGRANLTQAELAERMGTSSSTIAALETVEPGLSMLKRLAEPSRMQPTKALPSG
jgi:DNA-binding XRE family transcriptional regulator